MSRLRPFHGVMPAACVASGVMSGRSGVASGVSPAAPSTWCASISFLGSTTAPQAGLASQVDKARAANAARYRAA